MSICEKWRWLKFMVFLCGEKENMKVIPFLIDHLITANLYLGYNSTFRHVSMLSYISCKILRVDIINLVFTMVNLKLVINFLHKIYFNFGFVWIHLFVDNFLRNVFYRKNIWYKTFFQKLRKKMKKFVLKRRKDSRMRVYFFKWTHGLISNYKRLKSHYRKRPKSDRVRFRFPQTVLFLSNVWVSDSIFLPLVNVVDTSSNLKKACYLINANHKSFKSMLFFVRLLVKDRIIIRRLDRLCFKNLICYNVL